MVRSPAVIVQFLALRNYALLSPIGRGKVHAFRRLLAQLLGRRWGMRDYRHDAHTVFVLHLPLIWLTTSRHTVWRGAGAARSRALVRAAGQQVGVDLLCPRDRLRRSYRVTETIRALA